MTETARERFEEKYMPEPNSGCWLWTGTLFASGYGSFWNGGKNVRAHRWSYEHHAGKIPPELQIDHLCRVRSCVNPAHMEAVTSQENTLRGQGISAQNARKTHCIYGHELTADNVSIWNTKRGPARRCRQCNKRVSNAAYAKRKAALANTEKETG